MLPGMELMACPNLAVPREVMHHVVRVESSYNRYAIGVVGGHLVRQPKSLGEALATVRMLEDRGFNFSIGLAQVNRYNLPKYGLESYEQAFDPCGNLQAGSRILADCHRRSRGDWGKAFSCYYSGNFTTGYRHGYVQKVFASMRAQAATEGVAPIDVVKRPNQRVVPVQRYPVRAVGRVAARTETLDVPSAPAVPEQVVSAVPAAAPALPVPGSAPAVAVPATSIAAQPAPSGPQRDAAAIERGAGGDGAFVFSP